MQQKYFENKKFSAFKLFTAQKYVFVFLHRLKLGNAFLLRYLYIS